MASRHLPLLAALGGLLPLPPAALAEDEAPDVALLEFLGSWEDDDGEWIDPLRLLDEMEAEGTKDEQTNDHAASAPVEEDDHD